VDSAVVDASLVVVCEEEEGIRNECKLLATAAFGGAVGVVRKERFPRVDLLQDVVVVEKALPPLEKSNENLMSHRSNDTAENECRRDKVI
jgi:hypothetical protein